MSKQNDVNGWLLKVLAVAILAVAASPAVSLAQSSGARWTWMAASPNEASVGSRDLGRLILANDMLAFQSTKSEWRLALSEVKRISTSKTLANALEIESLTGQVYNVGILDGQLTVTSPGKALQTIQRAVRIAPAPAALPTRATLATAAGGGGGVR